MLSNAHTPDCVVCVPARDEAERIPRLLRALAAQDVVRKGRRLKVVVVSNNSVDATVAVVRTASVMHKDFLDLRLLDVELPLAHAHVGTARRIAMDAAADWLEGCGTTSGIILTTDADAIAPPDWVSANLDALADAEIVGGRLVIEPEVAGASPLLMLHRRLEAYWAAVRALEDVLDPPPEDPAPRHGDHTGASLALRVETYRKVGGIPPIASGEDNALVAAVRSIGGRVRHAPTVSIIVSPREDGRAEGGMAQEMTRRREAVERETIYKVPAAGVWLERLRLRARLRAKWSGRHDKAPLTGSAHQPDVDPHAFTNVISYIAHCEALGSPHWEIEPLEEAIAKLNAMQRGDAVAAVNAAE